jgi:hypothetical protein
VSDAKVLPIKIRCGPTGNDKSNVIEIDGQDMTRFVRGISFGSRVGELTTVNLEFVKVDLDIEGTVDLTAMGNEWATYRIGAAVRDELRKAEGEAK